MKNISLKRVILSKMSDFYWRELSISELAWTSCLCVKLPAVRWFDHYINSGHFLIIYSDCAMVPLQHQTNTLTKAGVSFVICINEIIFEILSFSFRVTPLDLSCSKVSLACPGPNKLKTPSGIASFDLCCCLNSLRPSDAYMRQQTDHHWFR